MWWVPKGQFGAFQTTIVLGNIHGCKRFSPFKGKVTREIEFGGCCCLLYHRLRSTFFHHILSHQFGHGEGGERRKVFKNIFAFAIDFRQPDYNHCQSMYIRGSISAISSIPSNFLINIKHTYYEVIILI